MKGSARARRIRIPVCEISRASRLRITLTLDVAQVLAGPLFAVPELLLPLESSDRKFAEESLL